MKLLPVWRGVLWLLPMLAVLAACTMFGRPDAGEPVAPSITQDVSAADRVYPGVISVTVQARAGTTFDLAIQMSPTPANQVAVTGFRVLLRDGRVIDEFVSSEAQTQFEHRISVPDGVDVVLLQARDSADGYGGTPYELRLPGR
jgi:hypothetical protein